jgi:predicted DCC family thiol-disulfide oxidoreductase YuxK
VTVLLAKQWFIPHPKKMNRLTVLYNDQCPVCSFEIDHYRALCSKRGIDLGFEKISAEGPILKASALSPTEAKRRLHIQTKEGEFKVGVDAFLALWAEMPGYRILGRIVHLPGIYHMATLVYDRVLAPGLFWWDKRRLQCTKSACR